MQSLLWRAIDGEFDGSYLKTDVFPDPQNGTEAAVRRDGLNDISAVFSGAARFLAAPHELTAKSILLAPRFRWGVRAFQCWFGWLTGQFGHGRKDIPSDFLHLVLASGGDHIAHHGLSGNVLERNRLISCTVRNHSRRSTASTASSARSWLAVTPGSVAAVSMR